MNFKPLISTLGFLFSIVVSAQQTPHVFNFSARIIKPDGNPLQASSVTFRFSVTNPMGSPCVLFVNEHTIDMTGSFGYINIGIGSGTNVYPGSGSIVDVFNNKRPSINCQSGGPYVPGLNDQRRLYVQFNDGTGWQSLSPTIISAIPWATYSEVAENALSLGGILAANYVRKTDIPNCSATNEFLKYDTIASTWSCATATGTGTVTSVASGTGLTGGPITTTGTLAVDVGTTANKIPQLDGSGKLVLSTIPSLPASQITSGVLDAARLGTGTADNTKYLAGDGTWQTLPAGNAGTVTSVATGTGLTGGPITSSGTIAVDVGTTANKIVQLDGSARLPAVDGSQLTNLPAQTDSSKLPLAGGAMTGGITMGGFDITNVGHLTQAAQKTLKLGSYTSAQETTLVTGTLTPGGAGYKGTTWFNSTTNQMKYWDGSNVQVVGTGSGTVASVTGTAPITVDNTVPTAPVIGITLTASDIPSLDAAKITTGTLGTARLATGTADNTKYLRGDGTWQTLPAAGTGTVTSVATGTGLTGGPITSTGTIAVDTGTTNGKIPAVGVGDKLPISIIPTIDLASNVTGTLPIANGGTGSTTASGARTSLGLGTAAVKDTGSSAGDVPALGVGGLTANQLCTADGTGSSIICTSTMPTSSQWTTTGSDIYYNAGGVSIGNTSVNSTAVLDITSTTKGLLIPRMTSAQRTAITTPATGLQVYDTTTNELNYYNGSGWQALGVAGSGLTSLNGLTAGSQTFGAIDTLTGTAPAWSSTTSTHTLRIPMASASSVTAGLISKTDYDNFNTKLGDISNTATLTNGKVWVGDASNKSQEVTLSGDATVTNTGAVTVAKIQGTSVKSGMTPTNGQVLTWDNTNSRWDATTPSAGGITALTGDVTASGSGSVIATVANVGGSTAANVHSAELLANAATNANTASTIVKRDASGNFSAGAITASLTGAASLNVLKAGDTMSGSLTHAANTGDIYTAGSGSNTVAVQGPTAAIGTSYVLRLPTSQGTANQVLTNDGSGNLSWSSPGGASSLSSLTAATATNTIDNLNFAQIWNWSTANTQSPLTMTANALTTGSVLNITTSNNSLNSTNGLLRVANTGTSTNGMVARIQSNNTAGSGVTVLANGTVGVGTATPTDTLQVSGTIRGKSFANAGTTIDWSKANTQSTTAGCTGTQYTFQNMQDGGVYTLVITGTFSANCTFGQTTPDVLSGTPGSGNFYFLPANSIPSGSNSVYSFMRVGSNVYIQWNSGFAN